MHLVISNPKPARALATARSPLNVVVAAYPAIPARSWARTATEIDREADYSLETLFATSDSARELMDRARSVLVFPRIGRSAPPAAGYEGDGVMRTEGMTNAYYRIIGASVGRQMTSHTFSLAFYFLAPSALEYLERRGGWNLGFGPNLVVATQYEQATTADAMLNQEVYAIPFNQHGPVSGLGLEGSRIFRLRPSL